MPIETVTKYVVNGREFLTYEDAEREECVGKLRNIYKLDPLHIEYDNEVVDIDFDELSFWIKSNKRLTQDILKNI